jgi:hypothetical protein
MEKFSRLKHSLRLQREKKIVLRVSTKTGLVPFWREFDGL